MSLLLAGGLLLGALVGAALVLLWLIAGVHRTLQAFLDEDGEGWEGRGDG